MSDLTGKAQTVLGSVEPGALGVTLPHEHLLVDLRVLLHRNNLEPTKADEKVLYHQTVRLENRWWVAYRPLLNLDNNALLDEATAIREAGYYRAAGGGTIVDMGLRDIGRDPQGLARISRATGLHIIMGCGYYVGSTHPSDMDGRTEDAICDEIVRDITNGVAGTGIRAGVIGEIGCEYPLTANERKVLAASARAQQITGAHLAIHPGRHFKAPAEIVDILTQAGVKPQSITICHVDRTLTDFRDVLALARTGVHVEYDLFGEEGYYFVPSVDLPNDATRINELTALIGYGHLDQLLVSLDICQKFRLRAYGGHGYDHIQTHALPVMRLKGISEAQIHHILVQNPARCFAFE